MDTADSNKARKLSWANIKTTLKAYFDTLYAAAATVSFPGFGTTGSTACVGNDARLSDSRTPVEHNHVASDVIEFNTAVMSALGYIGPTNWSPVMTYATPGTLSITASYGGRFMKIGKFVTCWFSVRVSAFSKGTASGALIITGLPYTPEPYDNTYGTLVLSAAPFGSQPAINISAGSKKLELVKMSNNGGVTALDDPDSNSEYYGTVTYFTSE
jgi:hypothetical protein